MVVMMQSSSLFSKVNSGPERQPNTQMHLNTAPASHTQRGRSLQLRVTS